MIANTWSKSDYEGRVTVHRSHWLTGAANITITAGLFAAVTIGQSISSFAEEHEHR